MKELQLTDENGPQPYSPIFTFLKRELEKNDGVTTARTAVAARVQTRMADNGARY
jgi:hypothetical protein